MLDVVLVGAFACVALLYSSVGQAGGTGYVAVMGLAGLAPEEIKSTALTLNILVAGIGCWRFYRAGLVTWRTCYPFALLGVPFSLIGGAVNLPAGIYQPVVGVLLLIAAFQMIRSARGAAKADAEACSRPPFLVSLLAGAAIGFVSGITGVGGGIFLAPLILTFGWVTTLQAGAVSAVFNLLNSAAALAGAWTTTVSFPPDLPWWLAAVGTGGLVGSWLGVRYLPPILLRSILAALLLAAGARMVLA